MKEKLYFRDEDSVFVELLKDILVEAKEDGLKEITIFEAIPDNKNPNYIFCQHAGEVGDRDECSKSRCEFYKSKSSRGVCANRGKLYTKGEQKTFKIE